MFLQEVIPNTTRYMVLGFTVAFTVMALYVFSLYIRYRNLQRDLSTLEEMSEGENA